MLSKSQLRLLSHLVDEPEHEVSIGELAAGLDWSAGHTSRTVSQLETNRCVRTSTEGSRKLVTLADIEPVEQFETLVIEYGHVDFPELVDGAGMRVLYYLDRPRTATELAERSGVSRATVYRRLDDLQAVGVVGKSASRYRLNEPFSVLSSIARGLAHHRHRSEAERHAGSVGILWETHDEYLFVCDTEIDTEKFHPTGPSHFAEFDIPLLTRRRRHYFRSDRDADVSPVELVCHTLLIDDDPRYRTYCLLLVLGERIDFETLRTCAEYYDTEADTGLTEIVDGLLRYLKTRGESSSDRLPSWEEFKRTAAEYDLSV